jgi:hypothetical protein
MRKTIENHRKSLLIVDMARIYVPILRHADDNCHANCQILVKT